MTHYGALALIILIADRLTKSWALNLTYEKIVNPFLSFALVFNRGINWGFFNAGNTALFIAINTAIAAVILGMFHTRSIAGGIINLLLVRF